MWGDEGLDEGDSSQDGESMNFKGQFGRTWWPMGYKELRGIRSQSCAQDFVPRRWETGK